MAGLGFEMKKVLAKGSFFEKITAVPIAVTAVVAPMLFSAVTVYTLREFMGKMALGVYDDGNKFVKIVYYIMMAAFILSSLIVQPLIRYVSDRLYDGRLNRILPSFYGGALCYLVICIPLYIAFITFAKIAKFAIVANMPSDQIILAAGLLSLVGVVFLEMLFVTSIRKNKYILTGFFMTLVISILIGILLNLFMDEKIAASLLGLQAGFATLGLFLLRVIRRNFPSKEVGYFDFLTSAADYPQLLLIGLMLSLGAFLHCLLLLRQPNASTYNLMAFYAYLSLLPMYVRFTLVTEVHFEVKYQSYYSRITQKGRYADIKAAHEEMKKVLWRELARMAEFQLIVALFAVSVGAAMLQNTIIGPENMPLFQKLVLAYFVYGLMQCLVIMLLYFDDRKGALFITVSFNILTAVLVIVFLQAGDAFLGAGFLIASVVLGAAALIRLNRYINYLEYFTFCSQPIYSKGQSAFARRVYELADKLNNSIGK